MRRPTLGRSALAVVLAASVALPASLAWPSPAATAAPGTATAGAAAPGAAPEAPKPGGAPPVDPATTPVETTAATEAVPGGPRRTSIRLSDDDASTTVLVHGLGSAGAAQGRENRSMRHSDLQPTARFAKNGDQLTITVPEGAPATSVVIGLIGVHAAHNDGADRGRWSTPLTVGENVITAPLDGMVHLMSTAPSGSADVVIEGGQPVPSFVTGQTTNEQLRAEMARLPDAPFVQVIGDRFFGDFQTPFTGTVIVTADMVTRVAELDHAIEVTNRTYGLLDEGTGLARKAPHRIYVAAPDRSGGYANATHERVTFPVSSGAAGDLFRAAAWDQWGWWHEIGHTYQTPTFNWGGQGEVLVNLSPLHIQSANGWDPRLDRMVGGYDAFFAKPVDERDYLSEGNLWVRLFLYDQLRRAFGDDFYPRLNQEYRVMKALGENQPSGSDEQRRLFARTASRVADRDLTEYFRQWGFSLDDATKAAMAELPALEQPIWLNRHSSEVIREHESPTFTVPVGEIDAVTESVTLGQRRLTAPPTTTGLRDSDGTGGIRELGTGLTAGSLGTGAGTATLTLVTDESVREVFSSPVTVTPGTSFQLRGFEGRVVANLALQPATDELRLVAQTTYTAHPYFGGDEYLGATVFDRRGHEVAGFSVRGDETAYGAAAAFDGATITDGMHLTVRHREAASRATRWDDGTEVGRNAATTQHYRVDDGRLVPVTAVPVPSALDAVPATTPVALERGTSVAVPLTVEATGRLRSLSAAMVVTAPAGTTLTPGQEALVTQVRLPGGDWVASSNVVATGSRLSADGRTLTLTLTGTDGLDLPEGTQLRWAPVVTVPPAAPRGGASLDWSLTGAAGDEEVTVRG